MRTMTRSEVQSVSGGDAITDGIFYNYKERPLVQQVAIVVFFPVFYAFGAYVQAGLGG